MKKLIEKWKPILEMMDISEKYYEKISTYADHIAKLEAHLFTTTSSDEGLYPLSEKDMKKTRSNPFKSLLPISLKILSKIKNLDSVHIMTEPSGVKDGKMIDALNYSFSISISQKDMIDLKEVFGLDIVDKIENMIIEHVSQKLNELISGGKLLYVYNLGVSLNMIVEKTFAPKLTLVSRFVTLDK